MDYDALTRLLGALERHRVSYAIFGAVALNLHGLARSTEDLDLFIRPESDNIERLKDAIRESLGPDPHIDEIRAEDLLGEYPAIQYFPPGAAFHLDLLTRLGEAFTFNSLETERLPFENLVVTVVTPRTLYLMKRDTVRLKDKADAEMIRKQFKIEDP